MNALEKVQAWLKTFPKAESLEGFHVDYTDKVPGNVGILPDGLVEVRRKKDITGYVSVTNQYNFGLYCVFEKAPGDNDGAAKNEDWIVDLQEWVQEQSATGSAPVFGDNPSIEKISAQNGTLFETDEDGTAVYVVQLSVQFIKKYKEENKWMI